VADGSRFMQIVTTLINKLNTAPMTSQSLAVWGSAFFTGFFHQKGVLPWNNFQSVAFKEFRDVGTEALASAFALQSRGCFSCPIACIKKSDVNNPLFKGRGMAPTYLAIGALGLVCGITDLTTIGMANMVCADMGLDPIAAGGTVATAMELTERKIVSEEDLKLPLRFGHGEDLLNALNLISTNKGHAQRLGHGGRVLAEEFNQAQYFMGVKGSPMAPFDPRGIQGIGLHFATSNYGPHHLYAYTFIDEVLNVHEHMDPWDTKGKPELVKRYQDMTAVMDSLGLCNWPLMGIKFSNIVPMVNAGLGTNYRADDLIGIGERIWNLERLFNIRAGFDRNEDALPRRFLDEPIPEGPAEGQVSRVEEMMDEYYHLRGWKDDGRPHRETLKALGLEGLECPKSR
jgi:aldehyde:ferredoxin oxidoreductase